ncbi:keratinocyte-associated protein 3 isoform X1 [Numida meleagris]|uniref:keratinocyte-associated protein 3 isoform X1 n=1 Tax=Numida meleagris TaxID=8996 RepID=UPI000B3E0B3C|nr:keratinocyte-associated protein 3 isoform X1 [Numida meleagris]
MAGGRTGRWWPGPLAEPQRLMRAGLVLIVLGHCNLVLGAIVHGSVLRHVARAKHAVTPEYAVANVVSVVSGLLSVAVGIVAILVSRNLSRAALHWALLSVSLLNCLLSTACSVGLALAIALTIHSRGMRLVTGCSSPALPVDARAAIATNDCPFNTTRIYVSMCGAGARPAPSPLLPLFSGFLLFLLAPSCPRPVCTGRSQLRAGGRCALRSPSTPRPCALQDTALALWFPSMLLAATEAVLSGRCSLAALVLQGIGPCARTYGKDQVARPGTVKERQLLVGLAETCA